MNLDPYKTPETKFDSGEGYRFRFEHNGHHIDAWGSGISGKEYVIFDGELISQKRTHSKKSHHLFEKDGCYYEIKFVVKSILSGRLECALLANRTEVKRYVAKET